MAGLGSRTSCRGRSTHCPSMKSLRGALVKLFDATVNGDGHEGWVISFGKETVVVKTMRLFFFFFFFFFLSRNSHNETTNAGSPHKGQGGGYGPARFLLSGPGTISFSRGGLVMPKVLIITGDAAE